MHILVIRLPSILFKSKQHYHFSTMRSCSFLCTEQELEPRIGSAEAAMRVEQITRQAKFLGIARGPKCRRWLGAGNATEKSNLGRASADTAWELDRAYPTQPCGPGNSRNLSSTRTLSNLYVHYFYRQHRVVGVELTTKITPHSMQIVPLSVRRSRRVRYNRVLHTRRLVT